MILNKDARADSSFIGVREAVVEASGNCVSGAYAVLLPYGYAC